MKRTASRLAWGLLALFLVLCAVALSLKVFRAGVRPSVEDLVFVVVFLAFGLVGALIASAQPGNTIGWLFLGVTVSISMAFFTDEYARYAFYRSPQPLPGAVFAAWYASWGWVAFIAPTLTFMPLLFPDGKLPTPRWRAFAWFAGLFQVFAVAGFALEPGRLEGYPITNPVGVPAFEGVARLVDGPAIAVLLIVAAVCLASLILRYRRAERERRQQIKWFAFAAALLVGWFTTSSILEALGLYSELLDTVFGALSFLSIPVAAGIGILKYRLFDVDLVINKTVVFAVLGALVTALYIGIVVGIGALVGSRSNLFLSIVATALIALLFQPLRERARHLANRLVYGKRATPYEVLSDFGERLAGSYATEDVLPRLARVAGEGVGASRATVWLHLGNELRPAASWPAEELVVAPLPLQSEGLPAFPEGERAFEVRHQGEVLGALTVFMPARESLTPTGEKLIQDLAAQAGLILRNVRLIEELRASRQRIVAAQDEERRRLERNIHDGAQQQLVALAVRLNLAQGMARKEAPQVAELLGAMKGETQETLENLRDLARGIYPPLLADKGLAAALESQARKAPVPVTVEPNGIGRYPQEAEAAAYFCVLEALQNVAKYAEADAATVRLGQKNGELVFEVVDDGRGFDPQAVARGAGLQNMADRLEALGGRLEVRSQPGEGTTVRGRIPASGGGAA